MALSVAVAPSGAQAQDYRFNSIRVEGNQRIEDATIASYTGIARGKTISAGELNDAYQKVMASGLFESVDIEPRGGTLVVTVTEYPTINAISFEGNRRIKDDALEKLIESTPRQVFNPAKAQSDADTLAKAYSQQGRVAATVVPRIIRRSENRVDLVFEISEGDTIEVERVSFVGNRVYSDRRLRRVMETKQANFLRTFLRSDTLIEDRIEFDKQVLRDFYLSRGYVDFRVNSSNVEFTRERDAFYLVMDITEGQQFRFGEISTSSEYPGVDAAAYQDALKIKPGVVYTPTLVENSITRMERLAIKQGVDFMRIEPRITRNDRDQTLNVEFVLTKGPRVFVERIDIEGNTTTLDRVVRQQFRTAEGDPFNPREIRASAERIRALGYFSNADVNAREGSSPEQVIVDVNVEEQPTGSFNLGGSYSVNNGFGVALGLSENNFLGRGQRLSFTFSTAEDAEAYVIGFTEPFLMGRQLRFDLDLGMSNTNSSYSTYDTERLFFSPALTFNLSEQTRLSLRYSWQGNEMKSRDTAIEGPVIASEIARGRESASLAGFTYTFDSRLNGLDPTAGFLLEFGTDYAGLGGDSNYLRTKAKAIAQKKILNEEVTLRASFEAGALTWLGDDTSRTVDRFLLSSDIMRGFEPGGIGPRDMSPDTSGNAYDDALGGNFYAVARFEADFPLGLPEEIGLRGGVFLDVGNLWGLSNVDTSAAASTCGTSGTGSCIVGEDGSWRSVIGLSFLWNTGFGPLRFNFSKAIVKEDYDKEQAFDLTLQAKF
ncbi:outer membrane protein assembly factor BamA [Pseudodonghicola flavimaris]|uniref:Outer membrane protein assembly factor BamA n=1 Tax=Pseudodonghicola flavimaris TaxID=3050036 RepID=A0ABT7F6Y6_9RHOB|nr:outer membrane protein assembly factor BamA [Pseudodonghicola flavimaris]MDK3020380.1 outer membrane protein assembly factor BamA [Pseudodonghicola flavimaris]